MATLYDKKGTEIYAGRGKYSNRARQMIERREAYTRSEEAALSVYVTGHQTPEGHARRRLENHINGKLGSLLSLMKELGLVHPIAVGNSKNYELSLRGRKVLADQTEVIE